MAGRGYQMFLRLDPEATKALDAAAADLAHSRAWIGAAATREWLIRRGYLKRLTYVETKKEDRAA